MSRRTGADGGHVGVVLVVDDRRVLEADGAAAPEIEGGVVPVVEP